MSRQDNLAIVIGADALLREGVARVLSGTKYRIRASESCVADLKLSLVPSDKSILLVMAVCDDIDSPADQVRDFKHQFPAARVVVLANKQDQNSMVEAFRAGVNAYFVKVSNFETFIKSLELVMLGETIFPSEILEILSDRKVLGEVRERNKQPKSNGAARVHGFDSGTKRLDVTDACPPDNARLNTRGIHAVPRLSARELAVLRCLAEGDSNKSIARKSKIAEATVKVHVKAILRKISVHNRTQAAIWAMGHFMSEPASNAHLSAETEPLAAAGANLIQLASNKRT